MQKRVVLVIAAVAVLGLAATVLGLAAGNESKGFVSLESIHEQHCVYRRNPGLGCGVAGALLALMAVFLATVATRDGPEPEALATTGRGRAGEAVVSDSERRLITAWGAVVVATVMFLYGAAMKRGLSSSRPDWRYSRAYYYGCTELKSEIFATGYAIAAVVSFQWTDESAPSVEMGHPAPPQDEHDDCGARQPAGTA